MRKQVLAVLLLLVVMISGCAEVSTAPIAVSYTHLAIIGIMAEKCIFPKKKRILTIKR